jgi:hypothetical protein
VVVIDASLNFRVGGELNDARSGGGSVSSLETNVQEVPNSATGQEPVANVNLNG